MAGDRPVHRPFGDPVPRKGYRQAVYPNPHQYCQRYIRRSNPRRQSQVCDHQDDLLRR